MQNQKEQWSGLVNRLKKQDKMLKKTPCQRCGERNEFDSIVCSESGEVTK
jgi:hypothetical protein